MPLFSRATVYFGALLQRVVPIFCRMVISRFPTGRAVLAITGICFSPGLNATAADFVQEYRRAHEKQILEEFKHLLAIPNHYLDAPNIARNAQFIEEALRARGVSTKLLTADHSPPVIYGVLRAPGAKYTIGIYAHYDGQPVAQQEWNSGPFDPVVRDEFGKSLAAGVQPSAKARIYARSASDDKAPIQAVLSALDAFAAAQVSPSVNLKFLFEGEEEPDSPHLAAILNAETDVTQADVWLLSDGPVHSSGAMQVYFGARGEQVLDLSIYGPIRPLHSGHYGNWAPNPIVMLSRLLASMRDEDGKVLIPDFYRNVRPLTAAETALLNRAPRTDDRLRFELQLGRSEGGGEPLAALILKPAVNIIGIRAGNVGKDATNIIATEAAAAIDLRFVPNQDLAAVDQAVEAHIRRQGFFIVRDTPDEQTRRRYPKVAKVTWRPGYAGYRAMPDSPAARAIVTCITRALGSAPIEIVGVGAAVPMHQLSRDGTLPVIGLPIANPDNNQHAANENIRLQNLWDGIAVFGAIFADGAKALDEARARSSSNR
jgi:acetylornithine deacetylase/succinyl-diaminopimelate desuccinylase-like protein